MKQKIKTIRMSIIIAIFMAMIVLPAKSQVSAKLGGGIGMIIPTSDLSGTTLDYYAGTNYGMESGLALQAKGKFGVAGFILTGVIDYSMLSNSGEAEPGQGEAEISQSFLSLKAGPEFQFTIPAFPVMPYVGAHLELLHISGETIFQGVSKVPSATHDVNNALRFGVGFSAGTEIGIAPLLSLDLNISYSMMNLVGKEWTDPDSLADKRIDAYRSLNDASDPRFTSGDDIHFISKDRNINAIVFSVSILFGI